MKLLLALLMLTGAYLGFLFYTTSVVLRQTVTLNQAYQYVAHNANQLAAAPNSP